MRAQREQTVQLMIEREQAKNNASKVLADLDACNAKILELKQDIDADDSEWEEDSLVATVEELTNGKKR